MATEDVRPDKPIDEPPPREAIPRDEPPEDEPSSGLTSDDKQWAMFAHLSAILTTYTMGMGFLGPLIIWLIKKDQSKFVDDQAKEALNFHLTLLIGELIGIATVCFIVGIFILIGLGVFSLVMSLIAGLKANNGEWYRYPLTIRFLK
jgi:uncharacterized Tic20 family protein